MSEVEGERHVATEREAADHGTVDAAMMQQCRHILDRQRLGIGRGICGIVALAVTAHIPDDNPVMRDEGRYLRVPHPASGAIAVLSRMGGPCP